MDSVGKWCWKVLSLDIFAPVSTGGMLNATFPELLCFPRLLGYLIRLEWPVQFREGTSCSVSRMALYGVSRF